MRVLLLPGDRGGCGLYRMIQPARAVANLSSDVELFTAEGLRGKSTRGRDGAVRVWSIPPIDADVVVFQRPLNDDLASVIPLVQAQGVAVVVELDDDFERVHPHNVAAPQVNPATSPHSNWEYLKQACTLADMVTVSTQALTRYAPHGRVRVVRNYLPVSILNLPIIPHSNVDPVRIGWTGTLATHPDDLTVTRGAVARVVADTGAVVQVVGNPSGVGHDLGLEVDPPSAGWVDLPHYPETIRDNLDIGIVPLGDIPFNQAKSALKGLEFAALGKPFVASPVAEYRRLAGRGVGLLASGRKDWVRHLNMLVRSPDYREELAGSGREVVRREFTIEAHAHEWFDAWTQALSNRDTRVSGGVRAAHR